MSIDSAFRAGARVPTNDNGDRVGIRSPRASAACRRPPLLGGARLQRENDAVRLHSGPVRPPRAPCDPASPTSPDPFPAPVRPDPAPPGRTPRSTVTERKFSPSRVSLGDDRQHYPVDTCPRAFRSPRPPITVKTTPPARIPVLRAALLGAALLALGGCASPSPPGPASTLSVAEARRAPPEEPAEVRWGGTIAEVRNTAAGDTVLEVVSRPLRRGGRPIRNDVTEGRFLAEVPEFLDPEIVKRGRDITVTGRVGESREGRIGETDYRFPVVQVRDYRYWKPAPPRTAPVHFPHPYPVSDPFYGPFWHGWPHVHHHYPRGGARVHGTFVFR